MSGFEEIYKTHFQAVYRYILRLSGSEEIAEEITSETFFKALRSLDRFRGECDLRVWLCRIGQNCYRTYLKKRRRTLSLHGVGESSGDLPEEGGLPEPVSPEKTPEERLILREAAEKGKKLLHALPEPYKEVFLWRVYGELSFREIGQLFDKNENWACVTYYRARKLLQKGMEDAK